MSSRLMALILTFAFLAPTATMGVVYLCRMDGQVHSTCCCQMPEHDPSTACARPKEACCCDVIIEAKDGPPFTLSHTTASAKPLPLFDLPGAVAADDLYPSRQAHPLVVPLHPPGNGRTIIVLVCSYLI